MEGSGPISATKQIPWFRVFVEGVVIVGSILLAFGIDAWWDRRQERSEEQRILLALEQDFAVTRTNLAKTAGETLQVQDSIMLLLGFLTDPDATMTPARLHQLIQHSLWTHFPEPRLSTYEEVVNSGQLGLIRSDSLRHAMALMFANMDDVQTWTNLLVQRWTTLEEPYLLEHVVIPEVYQGYRDTQFPAVHLSTDLAQVRTFEFMNLISGRVIHLRDIIGNIDEVVADLDTILALLDGEIIR